MLRPQLAHKGQNGIAPAETGPRSPRDDVGSRSRSPIAPNDSGTPRPAALRTARASAAPGSPARGLRTSAPERCLMGLSASGMFSADEIPSDSIQDSP